MAKLYVLSEMEFYFSKSDVSTTKPQKCPKSATLNYKTQKEPTELLTIAEIHKSRLILSLKSIFFSSFTISKTVLKALPDFPTHFNISTITVVILRFITNFLELVFHNEFLQLSQFLFLV